MKYVTLIIAFFLSLSYCMAQSSNTIPATDFNVARYWYSLTDQTPNFEAMAKNSRAFQRANQFDKADVLKRVIQEYETVYAEGFTGSQLLMVRLGVTLENYDFENSGFALKAFDGNTFLPMRTAFMKVTGGRVGLQGEYRIVFQNPEPYAFLPMSPQIAKELFAGRNSVDGALDITLQPVSAQEDQITQGYGMAKDYRTVVCRIVDLKVTAKDRIIWQESAEMIDPSQLAALEAEAGRVVDVSPKNIETFWYRLQGITPNFTVQALSTSAVRQASRFDRDKAIEDETLKAQQAYERLIPTAESMKGRISTNISEYDAVRGGFHLNLFSGQSFLGDDLNQLHFANGEQFAFVPMTPSEADAFLDTHGRYPKASVEFEIQPILAQTYLDRSGLASLKPLRRVMGHLTQVSVVAQNGPDRTVLIDETLPEMSEADIAQYASLPLSIDTALTYNDPDVVLTWAKIIDRSPDLETWATRSSDYMYANNEFIQRRLQPVLMEEREAHFAEYEVKPWRVRIGARISEYDFDNNRFEISRVAFGAPLKYTDGFPADPFLLGLNRSRVYELYLTNLADLQYISVPPAEAEELLTQLGTRRDVTLDLLVYPTKATLSAPWGEKQIRRLDGLVTDARLLGNTRRYGSGGITRIYETSIAEVPGAPAADVSIDAKPHIDPYETEVKGFTLGMSKSDFEKKAKSEYGKIENHRGNPKVLRFSGASKESGYGHFDDADNLVYFQYFRTLDGRGKTDAVVDSVMKKYGTPFARDNQNIGSKITYAYLYYSDPTELGLNAKDNKVGLWVEVQESSQLRPITQLEINLGTKP